MSLNPNLFKTTLKNIITMPNQTPNLIKKGESQNIEFEDSLGLKREIGEMGLSAD